MRKLNANMDYNPVTEAEAILAEELALV